MGFLTSCLVLVNRVQVRKFVIKKDTLCYMEDCFIPESGLHTVLSIQILSFLLNLLKFQVERYKDIKTISYKRAHSLLDLGKCRRIERLFLSWIWTVYCAVYTDYFPPILNQLKSQVDNIVWTRSFSPQAWAWLVVV